MTRKRPDRRPGLDELLGGTAALTQVADSTARLPVASLRPGVGQPRRDFDLAGLERLAESIRRDGVLQPLLVRPAEKGHEIVAGERRWRAAQLAGLTEVPVIVRSMTDDQARVVALTENLQREDLNLLDEVEGKLALAAVVLAMDVSGARSRLMQMLREEPGEQHAALDEAFAGLGESWASFTKNKIRILNWPPEILEAARRGLAFRVASMIAGAPAEHHAELLVLALGGAGGPEVQAAIRRLRTSGKVSDDPKAFRVAQVLGNKRFLSSLSPEAQRALERWLDKMPAAVRDAMEG